MKKDIIDIMPVLLHFVSCCGTSRDRGSRD